MPPPLTFFIPHLMRLLPRPMRLLDLYILDIDLNLYREMFMTLFEFEF